MFDPLTFAAFAGYLATGTLHLLAYVGVIPVGMGTIVPGFFIAFLLMFTTLWSHPAAQRGLTRVQLSPWVLLRTTPLWAVAVLFVNISWVVFVFVTRAMPLNEDDPSGFFLAFTAIAAHLAWAAFCIRRSALAFPT